MTDKADPVYAAEALVALDGLTAESSLQEIGAALRSFGAAVVGLTPLELVLAREGAVKRLSELKVKTAARLVDAVLPGKKSADTSEEKSVFLADPEEWPEMVDGGALLDEIEAAVSRYVALPEGGAAAVALWVLFAHCHGAFQISPLLGIVSPTKRCGKSTLLHLVGALVPRPLSSSNISSAALFRAVEAFNPTLLVDEADTFIKDNEELRGILNSGHMRASAHVVRCDGDDHDVKTFSTWAPKAVAMIGRLPSTLEDRSIVVPMRRRMPGEKLERLRLDRTETFDELRSKAARWAADMRDLLGGVDPVVPHGISSDRARDNWRPLLVISNGCGREWSLRARKTAVVLSGADQEEDSVAPITLLGDLRALFEDQGTDSLTSKSVVEALVKMEERPWPEWFHGKPISARQVAKLLKPFGVAPDHWRVAAKTERGYLRSTLDDAFSRYLSAPGGSQAAHPAPTENDTENGKHFSGTNPNPCRIEKDENENESRGVPHVPDTDPPLGEKEADCPVWESHQRPDGTYPNPPPDFDGRTLWVPAGPRGAA